MAKQKLDEVKALQVFVDAFIASEDRKRAHEAVEYKLRCQREYVIWRDGVVPPTGFEEDGKRFSTETLPQNDPGKLTVHRWRKSLKDPIIYDKTVVKEQLKVVSMLERGSSARLASTGVSPASYCARLHAANCWKP